MITVLMSTFNETESELSQSIESILNQTYSDFEYIIVNDNPTRRELRQILEKYAGLDSRIRIIENETNMGLAKSLNRGIEMASGDYIARMDADDVSFPDRLQIELEYLKKNQLDLVTAFVLSMDEDGEILPESEQSSVYEKEDIGSMLKWGNVVCHPTVLGKRSAFVEANGYRDLVPAEDYDLWMRMHLAGKRIGSLGERVLKYRVRTRGISRSNLYKQYLAASYIRSLCRKRRIFGKDFYDHKKFLDRIAQCKDQKRLTNFESAMEYNFEVLRSLRECKVGKCLFACVKMCFASRHGVGILINGFFLRLSHRSESKTI